MPERYDAIVIGAGATGEVAASRLPKLGLRTALIERELDDAHQVDRYERSGIRVYKSEARITGPDRVAETPPSGQDRSAHCGCSLVRTAALPSA